MPSEDIVLREGLKHMISLSCSLLMPASHLSAELFQETEDKVIDSFLDGLQYNGYEIRKINEAT